MDFEENLILYVNFLFVNGMSCVIVIVLVQVLDLQVIFSIFFVIFFVILVLGLIGLVVFILIFDGIIIVIFLFGFIFFSFDFVDVKYVGDFNELVVVIVGEDGRLVLNNILN